MKRIILLWIAFQGVAFSHGFNVFSKEEMKDLRGLRFVFVGGFLNEIAPTYFKDNIRYLRKLGIPRSQIHTIYPHSRRTVDRSTFGILLQLRHLHFDQKKLVLIGHSKGAVETLLTYIQYHSELSPWVHSVYLIQGPFKGSPISDFVRYDRSAAIRRRALPWTKRFAMRRVRSTLNAWNPWVSGGLDSLKPAAVTKIFQEIRQKDVYPRNDRRIFYVTSMQKPKQMSEFIDYAGAYLATHYGPADGLVPKDSQSLPWIGQTVASLRADHTDFTLPWPVSKRRKTFRYAFMQNMLFHVLYRKAPGW